MSKKAKPSKAQRRSVSASLAGSAWEKRLLYEVQIQFGAIERLLIAKIITPSQIGKARRYARRKWDRPNNGDKP